MIKLNKDGRFYHSLQVYEWMRRKGIYKFSSEDYALQFMLIWRVRGYCAAEHYGRNLPKHARNDRTYGMLLHCYAQERKEDIDSRPFWHLQKMKELGFPLSPRPFNEIMRIKSCEPEEVLEVFAEMKKSKVSPDNDSYRICISSFGLRNDVDGVERMLREMKSQPHIVMDWCTYAVLYEFYHRLFLGDKAADALEMAWLTSQKNEITRKRPNYLIENDYYDVIDTLVKLGELDEAMEFVDEWEALGYWCHWDYLDIPYTVMEEFIQNGKLQEAFGKIKTWCMQGKRGMVSLSRKLCKGYVEAGNVIQAFDFFRGTRRARKLHYPTDPVSFFKYLEEECGSLFPLQCNTRLVKANPIPPVQCGKSSQPLNMGYKNIIKSLVESGELIEARKMMTWLEASGNLRSSDCLNILKMIIEGYCEKCFFMEAEAMAEAWTRAKRCQVAEIWFVLASHYQLQGKMVKGFECMGRCFDLTPGLKGNYGMMFSTFLNGIQYVRGMNIAHGRV